MDDFFRLLASMSAEGSELSENIVKQHSKMLEKMKSKMERMENRLLRSKSLPKEVRKLIVAARIGNHSKCSGILVKGTDVNSRGASNETALCAAASGGHSNLLNLLLEYGADVNASDDDGDTPLMYAVMADELGFIKSLVTICADKVDINAKNKSGKTGIEMAFKSGKEKIVKFLSQRNAKFDCKEKHKKTLFKYAEEGKTYFIKFWFEQHSARETAINMTWRSRTLALVAALNGKLNVIKVLYDNGANLDIPDEDGDTPLFCAAQNGFSEIIRFLVSKNCDVNHRNKAGRTPISAAIGSRNFEIARYFYDHGARLTVVDMEKISLLLLSVASGSTELFKFMCEHLPEESLQFDEVTTDGETCLLAASQTNNVEIFKAILAKKVDFNHRNKHGMSAALRAAHNNQLEMVKLLQECGANLDLPNNGNQTAILSAAQQDNMPLLKLLVDTNRCNIHVQDYNGETLVYHAVKNRDIEMLCFLIESGAPIDEADVCGNTPFIVAVHDDCIEAVQRLVEKGRVNLNRRNAKGHTAVLLAVNNESENMLKYLLGLGCESDISDRSGDTPLLLAVKKKNYKLAKLLTTQENKECDSNTAETKTRSSCLHASAKATNPAFINLLSRIGANLDMVDSERNTPFAKSAKKDSAYLTILSAKGADVNRRNSRGQNAAHLCTFQKMSNLVVLEALGCCIDVEDFEGNAPIHLAVKNRELSSVEFLIEQGAEIDFPNRKGNTPIHLACKKGSSVICESLLEQNAKLKTMNNRKQTELMLACTSRNENIVKILLMRYSKEEINLQDIFRRTALHYAVKSKSENAANRLIEAGADVNILDIDGLAPILLAAKTSQWNVLSRAVENIDSNLLLKSKNGESIAHFAASNSSIETLKKLKEKLVPLTELTEESESCLTLAATGGSIEVCEFLISEGNQVSHCNRKGENAICKAAKAKNSELFFHLATCHRADFLLKDENGNSSLYYFLDGSESLDHSAISELLLDVDEQNLIDLNSQGFGLCHMAAKKDSVKLLRELRDRGWDLSKTTASGETCITLAAKTSGSKALKFLLELSRNKDAMEPELSKSKQEQEKAFRICAELGKIELTDELFSRGVNVNATDEEGNTALMIACQHKQNDFALSLLSRESIPRVDVDVKNQNGFSALHFASKNQLTDCVEKLLSLGAKTDSGNSEGYTCLHEAVRGPDSTDVAELLIDSGCDVNQKTSSDETSLLLALKKGSKKLTKFLISRGARVDAEKVPISLVVKKFLSQGRREIITWLLKLEPKLDVNKVDADGRHVLFDVIDHGAEEILRLFISSGADIDCEDKRSVTPFLHALAVGREDLAKVLLERGCNTEKRAANGFDCVLAAVSTRRLFTLKWLFNHVSGLNSRPQAEIRGKNALHFCCQIGHPQMFKLLLENGFDLNKQCDIGWTPIDYAIAEGHLAIIKAADAIQNRTFLSRYEHHANTASDVPSPFAKAAANGYESIFKFLHSIGVNFEGIADTTIPFACGNGQQHIIKFLLSVGVDIEAYKNPKNGQTALLTAMYSGDLHLISFLVDKIRCDIRAVCHNRNTAIQGAVTTNQERILNYLISKGALIDEPDAEGDTPVLEAALLGHQRMLDILLDHNCNIKRLNNQARGAIHMAVIKNDNPEMLQFLIDKEIPANGRDEKGNTACMIASYQGHQKSVKLLLEHDRSLGKERNADGSTPALLAAMKGKHEVLQVLAENDCLEANDVDNDGSTILMMAIQSGSVPTVRMLLETGDCNTTAVNNNGIGVQTLATQCRDEAMLELLRQFGIEGQLAEAEATEAQQTSTVGHPIELLIFTPDTPEAQEGEEDTDQQQEELEISASEIFNDAASQRSRSTYRSTMHAVRHAPILVSDGNFMQEPEHANQAGSLISSHHPVSVAERASTVASANLSDTRHDSQSIAS